jgi:hypothetical protein
MCLSCCNGMVRELVCGNGVSDGGTTVGIVWRLLVSEVRCRMRLMSRRGVRCQG